MKSYLIQYYNSASERVEGSSIAEALNNIKGEMQYVWKITEITIHVTP